MLGNFCVAYQLWHVLLFLESLLFEKKRGLNFNEAVVEALCTATCTSNKHLQKCRPLNSNGRKLCDYHEESALTFVHV
jgi:hypothetical protein